MDWIINDELGLTVGHVVGWAAATAMVVGGIIPYVPQYRQIKETQDADGFSLHVCLALLVANTLRILFWFSRRYELPLLVQSIVMNLTMFLMIHLCVRVKRTNAIMKTRDRVFADDLADMIDTTTAATSAGASAVTVAAAVSSRGGGGGHHLDQDEQQLQHQQQRGSVVSAGDITIDDGSCAGGGLVIVGAQTSRGSGGQSKHYLSDFDRRYFWAWTDFQSYLDFMLIFWAVGAAVTYLLLNVEWFMETVGFFAVFTEAMLGLPQFLRNFNNKSTAGMSITMVIMWTLGDMFKTLYFLVRAAPVQFWICGTLQVCLDIAILLQVYLYRKSPAPRNAHRGD